MGFFAARLIMSGDGDRNPNPPGPVEWYVVVLFVAFWVAFGVWYFGN